MDTLCLVGATGFEPVTSSVSEIPGDRGDLRRVGSVPGDLGRWWARVDRYCPLRSSRSWPGCGPSSPELGRRVPAVRSAGMLRRWCCSARLQTDRCCPWLTVRDRCYGHAEGTADDDQPRFSVATMVTS
jgi:hypothetical protein